MNRCEFINSLSSSSGKDIEEYILNYFNEVMLLYSIFGSCDNVSISIIDGKINPFIIHFDSEEGATKMNNATNGMILSIYGSKYTIDSSVEDKSILISLINQAGMV